MYTVQRGDSMWRVATRFGVSLTSLIRVNPEVANPSVIHTGARLRIPGQDSFTPATAPAARTRPQAAQQVVTLHRGSTGAGVRELQKKLVSLGYLSTAAVATGPGVFGPRTERAVQQFQAQHRIKTTGVVGSYTQAALAKALEARRTQKPAAPAPSGAGYKGQFNGQVPASSVRNTRAWEPVHAPVRSNTGNRSAARYSDVINQFAVGVNPRYRPRSGNTYCNIFVWDVTRAMGAELPHWWKGRELDANSANAWLNQNGGTYGWRRVDARTAQAYANAGRPSVASWRNPTGIGHIAMVRPGSITAAGPAAAQAGARNFNQGHIANGFGWRQPEYWVHA